MQSGTPYLHPSSLLSSLWKAQTVVPIFQTSAAPRLFQPEQTVSQATLGTQFGQELGQQTQLLGWKAQRSSDALLQGE